jgi:hypothetical protein
MERRPEGTRYNRGSCILAFPCEAMMAYAGRQYIVDARNEDWSYTTILGWLAELTVRGDKFKIVELNP